MEAIPIYEPITKWQTTQAKLDGTEIGSDANQNKYWTSKICIKKVSLTAGQHTITVGTKAITTSTTARIRRVRIVVQKIQES